MFIMKLFLKLNLLKKFRELKNLAKSGKKIFPFGILEQLGFSSSINYDRFQQFVGSLRQSPVANLILVKLSEMR